MQLNFFNSNLFYIFDLSKGKETPPAIKGRDTQSAENHGKNFELIDRTIRHRQKKIKL